MANGGLRIPCDEFLNPVFAARVHDKKLNPHCAGDPRVITSETGVRPAHSQHPESSLNRSRLPNLRT